MSTIIGSDRTRNLCEVGVGYNKFIFNIYKSSIPQFVLCLLTLFCVCSQISYWRREVVFYHKHQLLKLWDVDLFKRTGLHKF